MLLAKILFDDRIAHNYDPRKAADTDAIVQTFLPITRSVPAKYLYESYVVALENRAQGNNFQITAIELVQAWKVVAGRIEMESSGAMGSTRQLPERAAAACERCGGHGREEMPDGSVREGCEHKPMTDAERDAQARRRIDQVAAMRAELRKPAKPLPVETKPKPAAGQILQCSACARKVNTLLGWKINETCKMKLDRESELCPKCEQPTGVLSQRNMVCRECFHVYEVVTCEGRMVTT
ncbi:MAG: hypothetical protein ACR2LC_09560 [Pyrinomonadaceae bacterium]